MPTLKTLDDVLEQEDRYDIDKIAFFRQTDDNSLIILDLTLYEIYRRFIAPAATLYQVTDREREFYRYRPHLLSQDFYGTPELCWLVLRMNDTESPSRFRPKRTLKLVDPSTLSDLYDRLVTKSSERLYANWGEELKKVGDDI